jgi:hypothetical protein
VGQLAARLLGGKVPSLNHPHPISPSKKSGVQQGHTANVLPITVPLMSFHSSDFPLPLGTLLPLISQAEQRDINDFTPLHLTFLLARVIADLKDEGICGAALGNRPEFQRAMSAATVHKLECKLDSFRQLRPASRYRMMHSAAPTDLE